MGFGSRLVSYFLDAHNLLHSHAHRGHRREKRGRSSIADAENRERRDKPNNCIKEPKYKVRKYGMWCIYNSPRWE